MLKQVQHDTKDECIINIIWHPLNLLRRHPHPLKPGHFLGQCFFIYTHMACAWGLSYLCCSLPHKNKTLFLEHLEALGANEIEVR